MKLRPKSRSCSVRDARWKWIGTRDRRTGESREEAFDLSKDPGETAPLPAGDPGFSAAFRAAVEKARRAR